MARRTRSGFCKMVSLVSLGVSVVAGGAVSIADPPASNAPVATAAPTTPPATTSSNDALQGDATRGKALYQNCTACHSIDDDDIGPRHRGVVGRTAGTVPGYPYSAALKASGIVWDKTTL